MQWQRSATCVAQRSRCRVSEAPAACGDAPYDLLADLRLLLETQLVSFENDVTPNWHQGVRTPADRFVRVGPLLFGSRVRWYAAGGTGVRPSEDVIWVGHTGETDVESGVMVRRSRELRSTEPRLHGNGARAARWNARSVSVE